VFQGSNRVAVKGVVKAESMIGEHGFGVIDVQASSASLLLVVVAWKIPSVIEFNNRESCAPDER
jgi:hypothetical protein